MYKLMYSGSSLALCYRISKNKEENVIFFSIPVADYLHLRSKLRLCIVDSKFAYNIYTVYLKCR